MPQPIGGTAGSKAGRRPSVNPNFDFRDSTIWDDRSVPGSVGDGLTIFRQRVLGGAAAIFTALCLIGLVML